jgi:hypothetical protein
MSEWSRLLYAINGFAEKRAVPSFIKGVGNAWHIDYANRVSADKHDGELPTGWSLRKPSRQSELLARSHKRKPAGGAGLSNGEAEGDDLGFIR